MFKSHDCLLLMLSERYVVMFIRVTTLHQLNGLSAMYRNVLFTMTQEMVFLNIETQQLRAHVSLFLFYYKTIPVNQPIQLLTFAYYFPFQLTQKKVSNI